MEFHRKWPHHFRGHAFWKSQKITFHFFWQIMIFCDFQNASPRKWCCLFRWNCTELNYSMVLQTDGVTAFELIPTPLCITSELGHFVDFSTMGYQAFWPCSEVKFFEIEISAEAVTPSVCSTMEYFNSVEFHRNWPHHFRGHAFWKSKKIDLSHNGAIIDFSTMFAGHVK